MTTEITRCILFCIEMQSKYKSMFPQQPIRGTSKEDRNGTKAKPFQAAPLISAG
jgi:hypothetical protein